MVGWKIKYLIDNRYTMYLPPLLMIISVSHLANCLHNFSSWRHTVTYRHCFIMDSTSKPFSSDSFLIAFSSLELNRIPRLDFMPELLSPPEMSPLEPLSGLSSSSAWYDDCGELDLTLLSFDGGSLDGFQLATSQPVSHLFCNVFKWVLQQIVTWMLMKLSVKCYYLFSWSAKIYKTYKNGWSFNMILNLILALQ